MAQKGWFRYVNYKNNSKRMKRAFLNFCVILTWVPRIHSWAGAPCCGMSIGTNPSVCPKSPEPSLAVGQPATGGALSAADATLHWGLPAPQQSLATASEGYHPRPDAQTHRVNRVGFNIFISSKFKFISLWVRYYINALHSLKSKNLL